MRRLKNLFLSIFIILFWSSTFVPAGFASQLDAAHDIEPTPTFIAKNSTYLPDQILVRFKPGTARNKHWGLTGNPIKQISKIDVNLYEVPTGQMESTLAQLRKNPDVLFAEPNYVVHALETIPNDPYWSYQHNLRAIRAPQGWDLSTGGSTATIAVIDTGIDLNNPELAAKILQGIDYVDGDNIPQDEHGHGTHVAGIAAAVSNNSEGIAGVSWGAKILPVRVLDAEGSGTYDNVASAIVWAADQGAQVLNLSLGGLDNSDTLEKAVNYAISKGVIVVAAAGNYGDNSIFYPANYPGVIAVGATDEQNNRAYFSSYGKQLDLVAPGDSIISLDLWGDYTNMSGTSMASPHVAGLAAILVSLPGNSSALVEHQMEASALDLGDKGWDQYFGNGLIQVDRAILLAHSFTPTATPKPPAHPQKTPTSQPLLSLPETGFTHEFQQLPAQPNNLAYTGYAGVRLEIPAIAVDLPIVGVPHQAVPATGFLPEDNQGWDLTWLGERAGWLNGSTFPTWKGNSVITGHVWDADNSPGAFAAIKQLKYGEQVNIHAWGQVYTYQVRTNQLTLPGNFNLAFKHETNAWVTLVTCENYDPLHNKYVNRRIVRAVLTNISPEP
ncbi:MAG: S8 family serine peptidase [Chloroflexota bacterium]